MSILKINSGPRGYIPAKGFVQRINEINYDNPLSAGLILCTDIGMSTDLVTRRPFVITGTKLRAHVDYTHGPIIGRGFGSKYGVGTTDVMVRGGSWTDFPAVSGGITIAFTASRYLPDLGAGFGRIIDIPTISGGTSALRIYHNNNYAEIARHYQAVELNFTGGFFYSENYMSTVVICISSDLLRSSCLSAQNGFKQIIGGGTDGSGALATWNGDIRIGNRSGDDRVWSGIIENVRVWNRQLTLGEAISYSNDRHQILTAVT